MPNNYTDLVDHLDLALEHLLTVRLRAGAQLPATVPTEVVEAAAAGDDNYRQARRDAADALGVLLSAVEDDETMTQLVMEVEAAYLRLASQAMDLGWRVGATLPRRGPGAP